MKFLLLLLFIGVFGVMIISSLLRGVSSFFFGKQQSASHSQTSKQTQNNSSHQSASKSKKLFDKNEGEYVTYEEIEE